MTEQRQTDKWILCGGTGLMVLIAVAGHLFHNNDLAIFGAGGFTAFSGPLFMVINRELGNSNGHSAAGAAQNPTQEQSK